MSTKYSQRASGILAVLADRPVAYHPKLASVLGVKETVFVCQLLYWDGRGARDDGFVWKIQTEITEETGLSRYEQETVRKNLIKRGVLEEKLMGIPAKLYYRLDFEALASEIEQAYPPDKEAETPAPSLRKPRNQDRDVSANFPAGNPQTITEITAENTTENTAKNTAKNNPPPERKPDYLDAIVRFSGASPEDNWADPADAGGADDWAVAVDAFAGLVAVDPSTLPASTRREWSRMLREIGREWQAGPGLLAEIVGQVPESEFGWKTYASPHQAKADLGVLVGQHRNGGVRKAKRGKGNGRTSTLASIDAFREKLRARQAEADWVDAETYAVL